MVAVEVVVEVFGMLVLPDGLFMRMFSTTAILAVGCWLLALGLWLWALGFGLWCSIRMEA